MTAYRMTACRDGEIAIESFDAATRELAEQAAARWLRINWNCDESEFADIGGELDGLALDELEATPSGDLRPLVEHIAQSFQAMLNCKEPGNSEWQAIHASRIASLVSDHLPSGSGFDNGTTFEESESRPDKLIFSTSFHHMNDSGFYDGWTEHRVIVTPSFIGRFDIKISGRDKRSIKDYIAETFESSLSGMARLSDCAEG